MTTFPPVPGHDRWQRVDRALWGAVDGLLLVCVTGMLLAVTCQVASRLLGASLPWTEELSRLLFIWTAFLGMAVGFRQIEHPRITAVLDRLPVPARLGVHLYAAAGIAFFTVAGWHAARLVLQQLRFGETSPVLGINMYLASLPVVIATCLAVVAHVHTAYLDPASGARLAGEAERTR